MTTPTVSFGMTTIDLGYVGPAATRTIDERVIVRRTLDGNLRTTVLSSSWRYQLPFSWTLRGTYDALVTLWRAARTAGAYPTFSFVDVWPSADAVAVGLEIGPLTWILEDCGSYTLTLTEVAPMP